jgi:hypothetical protein
MLGLVVLLMTVVLVSSAAVALAWPSSKPQAVSTSGSMFTVYPTYYDNPIPSTAGPYTWHWQWDASSDTKSVKGTMSLRVSHPRAQGGTEVLYSDTSAITSITKVSNGVVQFTTATYLHCPNDPGWGDKTFEAVEGGKTGDVLYQHDWIDDTFRQISVTGSVKIH